MAAAILLVALAVVLVVARSWLDGRTAGADANPIAALPSLPELPGLEPDSAADDELAAESDSPAVVPSTQVPPEPVPVAAAPQPPVRIIVMPARVENPESGGQAIVEAVRLAMLTELRSLPSVAVIDLSAADIAMIAPANAGPLRSDRAAYLAVSQHYGSQFVVELSESSAPDSLIWNINMQAFRANGFSGSGGSLPKPVNPLRSPSNDPESLGRQYARRVVDLAITEVDVARPAADAGESRSILLDSARPERERLRALSQLRGTGLSADLINAAADLATRSASAETRRQALRTLRQSAFDPTLAPHFSYALLSDPDEEVRREAALALAAYLNDGSTRPALERAMRSDLSADVRFAAQMAMMDYDEKQAFKRETLLDTSLSPAERLAPTTMDDTQPTMMTRFSSALGSDEQDEVLAFAEIVAASDDLQIKAKGIAQLSQRLGIMPRGELPREVVDVLIDSAGIDDAQVQRTALNILRLQTADPEVRELLQSVIETQPELATQLRLAEALERQLPEGRLPVTR